MSFFERKILCTFPECQGNVLHPNHFKDGNQEIMSLHHDTMTQYYKLYKFPLLRELAHIHFKSLKKEVLKKVYLIEKQKYDFLTRNKTQTLDHPIIRSNKKEMQPRKKILDFPRVKKRHNREDE